MHPMLCEYVGFQEVEITPLPDGTARVATTVAGGGSGRDARLGRVACRASWRRVGDFFLTSASAGLRSEVDLS